MRLPSFHSNFRYICYGFSSLVEEGILVCLSLTRIFLVLQVRGFGSKLFISLILYFELHKVIIFPQPIHFNNMQHEVVFLWLKMLILVVSLTLPIINIAFFKKTLGLYLKKHCKSAKLLRHHIFCRSCGPSWCLSFMVTVLVTNIKRERVPLSSRPLLSRKCPPSNNTDANFL